jgi:tRNA pseudouridine38-40 synthase
LEIQKYRVDAKRLETFREALQHYKGSHIFHNFTVGKSFQDHASRRYMLSLTVGDPFEKEGIQWVSIKIHGQSFMLHQIRKMISMAIMIVRTETPSSLIDACYENVRVNIPKAPALGLLLEKVNYYEINF